MRKPQLQESSSIAFLFSVLLLQVIKKKMLCSNCTAFSYFRSFAADGGVAAAAQKFVHPRNWYKFNRMLDLMLHSFIMLVRTVLPSRVKRVDLSCHMAS
jgi:hypothetical protein